MKRMLGYSVAVIVLALWSLLFGAVSSVDVGAVTTVPTNTNEVPYWCGSADLGVKLPGDGGTSFVVPEPPDGRVWTLLVIKAGSDVSVPSENETFAFPAPGSAYAHSSGKVISHVILCHSPVPTTTLPPTTTPTTLPPTTQFSVPTTQVTTTTTTAPTTTTSTTSPSTSTASTSTSSSTVATVPTTPPTTGQVCTTCRNIDTVPPTITVPFTLAPTTLAPTTTSAPPTTVPSQVVPVPDEAPPELPRTGSGETELALAGAALAALGLGIVARRCAKLI